MTIPESAATRFVERAPPRAARQSALERLGRWVAARGWIHVLLFTGVVGCMYPIVWMFMTSIKTDEELGQAGLELPMVHEVDGGLGGGRHAANPLNITMEPRPEAATSITVGAA